MLILTSIYFPYSETIVMNLDCQAQNTLSALCGGTTAQTTTSPHVSARLPTPWQRFAAAWVMGSRFLVLLPWRLFSLARSLPESPLNADTKKQRTHAAWARSRRHIAHLDARILQDIGAPAWIINETTHKQAQEAKRLISLIGR
ncbi:hypothetical protein [Allopusillimonas ginsengisoli]|uniref:hypothetical protein n=1 Tax=Allopusillimonas ginsengisoli TaxID=453575 RepID=UPI00101EB8F2|nr:hypothetical protein [Allopusillimonas ginsengisoli]TEA79871.1 hypothetical protein ERE07_02735 [Allopusillimonas ginsengisoli]